MMEKKRTRAEELGITRRKILNTARDLFMEKGYRAVSTREIAKIANITQPALYHHFEDKESLYIEVVRELTQNIQVEMHPIMQVTKAKEEQLHDMLIMLIEEHPTNILLMIHDILNEMKPENQFLLYKLWQKTYLEPFQLFFERLEMLANCVMVSVLRLLRDTVCPLLALFFLGKAALRKSKRLQNKLMN